MSLLFVAIARLLPETLHDSPAPAVQRAPPAARLLGARRNPRFLLLALASGIPFNGMFLYVLSAPVFLGEHPRLAPGEFFWFFLLTIAGIMGGALLSGRMAGRSSPAPDPPRPLDHGGRGDRQPRAQPGFSGEAWWALVPIALYAFGWALMVPVVTLMVLDLVPERRGMASSFQAAVGSAANGAGRRRAWRRR